MKIGFVGLGIMGQAMARNLLRANYALTVWNRTPGKADALVSEGASKADSAKSLSSLSDIIITVVNDTPDVEQVLFDDHGIVAGLTANKTVIDMSTISPEATEEFAERISRTGAEMLDAPVSGGDVGAKHGTLTIMVGGNKRTYERCLPVFRVLGENIVYCGGHGNGQRTKMINQVFCGLHAVALSEALVLAERIGLDLETTHKVVSSGAAASWALENYGPRILQGDLQPGFKLGMQLKDLRIAHESADKQNAHFPGIELAYRLFTEAKDGGLAEFGSHGLIELYRSSTPHKS